MMHDDYCYIEQRLDDFGIFGAQYTCVLGHKMAHVMYMTLFEGCPIAEQTHIRGHIDVNKYVYIMYVYV